MANYHPSQTWPNRPQTVPEPAPKDPPPNPTPATRRNTPPQRAWDDKISAPSPAARTPWHAFSKTMAAVEVCVVAWLAGGVVAGLLDVVWVGPGLVWKGHGAN